MHRFYTLTMFSVSHCVCRAARAAHVAWAASSWRVGCPGAEGWAMCRAAPPQLPPCWCDAADEWTELRLQHSVCDVL